METALKTTTEIHGRLKTVCEEKGIPLKSGTNALLSFALDSLDKGTVSLSPVTATPTSSSPVPHNEEANTEGGAA